MAFGMSSQRSHIFIKSIEIGTWFNNMVPCPGPAFHITGYMACRCVDEVGISNF